MELFDLPHQAKTLSQLSNRICDLVKFVPNEQNYAIPMTKDDIIAIIWAGLLVENNNVKYKVELK